MEVVSQRYKRNTRLYLMVMLVALELLMSFSFLGYLHVEPISITTAYIPVLLAGALLGLPEAVILGTVFGLASMWKASASYVMPVDQLFSPITSGHPLESILLSVGSRMLFGLVIGLLYLAARRIRYTGFLVCMISFFGPFFHSLLVYGAMGILFPEAGYHAGNALQSFFSVNNFVTNLMTMGLVFLFWRLEQSKFWQEFRARVEKAQNLQLREYYHRLSLAAILVLTICLAMAVGIYFVHRMDYVLRQNGIILSDKNYSDLIHLQIQFLIGILAMMTLVIIFLIFNRRYATYMNYVAKIDALTGVMTRKAFFETCSKVLRELHPQEGISGYFIMIDVDSFKEINDQYGHPAGDRILQKTAEELREVFGRNGLIGRVGGDEFAVLVSVPITPGELETDLQLFRECIHKVGVEDRRLSCSIGAIPVTVSNSVTALYQGADRLMYFAKKQGRDQYVIGGLGNNIP